MAKRMPKGAKEVEKRAVALERLEVSYVSPDVIKPNSYNPNRQSEHDFELLMRSMREDGFTQPIVVLRSTNEIVDGEHRWRAAQALGHKEIPVVYVDMTPEQMRIATLRHNRARGNEEMDLAAEVLRDLQKLGAIEWAQDSLMLSDEEIRILTENITAPDLLAGEEFSEAWVPDAVGNSEDSLERDIVKSGSQATVEKKGKDKDITAAMSPAAIEATREKEKKMQAAKTLEEKEMARKDSQKVVQIYFTFTSEEAAVVNKALGTKTPAAKLYELCKRELESRPAENGKSDKNKKALEKLKARKGKAKAKA